MSDAISAKRTRNYVRQLKGAALYRAVAMAASYMAIPLMIRVLGQEQYGVWSTLLTIMSWIVFFDLGVGNGLRNKVAESLATNDTSVAARFIGSGYCVIGLIALTLWIFFMAGSFVVPWQTVFNTIVIPEAGLGDTIRIAASFVLLNLWVGLIGALLGAVQKTSVVALGQLLSNLLILCGVFVLARYAGGSITRLAFVYGAALVFANLLLSVWFYRHYPGLRPRLALERSHVRPLLSVGVQFFTIQLAVLLLFTTDKMLITQLFGPQYVTGYDVVFKLFSVVTLLHGLVSAPLWSAYTDAYQREDLPWIRRMLKKQMMVLVGMFVLVFALTLLAKPIVGIWIGEDLEVSTRLILVMALLVLVISWNNVFAMFVNGIGKIRVQLLTSIVAMSINIPLSIVLAKYTSLGVSAVVVGTICSLSIGAIAVPLQVRGLLRSVAQPRPS